MTLRITLRALRRSPAFSLAAALTFAIGIGGSAAVMTVLNAVLFKPLPYPNADRLAGAWFALPGMHFDRAPQSLATYFTYKRLARSIDGIAVSRTASANLVDNRGDRPERLRAASVSASVFSLLQPRWALGRGFTEAEDTPHGDAVVAIGDGLWRRRFGGDRGILGKEVEIDGRKRTIVGVLPGDFHYPDAGVDLWLPIGLDEHAAFSGPFGLVGFVRLRPGVSRGAAERELNELLPRSAELFPMVAPSATNASFLAQSGARAFLRPLRDDMVGGFSSVLWIAAVAGFLVLIISCANVASLVLTRAEGRRRDAAIRLALGASRRDVASGLLLETSVLAGVGGALGVACAAISTAWLVAATPLGIPRIAEIRVDGEIVVYTVVVTALVAILCSVLPSLRTDARGLAQALRSGGRSGTAGRDRQRARRLLVGVQVAFAVALVAGAVLLLRSADHLRRVRPGFAADHALTAWLSLPLATYSNDAAVVRVTRQLISDFEQASGVEAIGVSSKLPLGRLGSSFTPVWTDAAPPAPGALPPSKEVVTATGGYFEAMGIPLVAGRTFRSFETQPAYEAVIDRAVAQQFWNDSTGTKALGRKLRLAPSGAAEYTVVGVVGATHDTSLAAPPSGIVYFPDVVAPDSNQSAVTRTLGIAIRTRGDPAAFASRAQEITRSVDPSIPLFSVAAMTDVVAASTAKLALVVTILAASAVVALVLAAVGLYGVIAYIVSLRTKEISVRMALGASPSAVARLIARQATELASGGIVVGMLVFLVLSRLLRSLVYDVPLYDPLTLALVSATLFVVAFVASWIPARAASRVDAVLALGAE